jgi:NADH-quinone oxidoreductase subunit K
MVDPETALLQNYLIVGAILFGVGLIGFLCRRNMIVMFLCAEMMLQGVSVSLVAWGRYYNDLSGQIFVVFIIAVAACEAAIGLALILMLYHRRESLDIILWQDLREADQPLFIDQELPEKAADDEPRWPTLPPAGQRPELPRTDTEYRPHV